MSSEFSKAKVIRITLNGVLAGLVFLLMAFFIEAFRTDNSISFNGLVSIHKENPLFIFFDFFPVIFGVLAYYYGGKVVGQLSISESLIEEEESRSRKLYRFVERIRNGEIDADFHADEDDVLGKAIVNLRDNLKASKEEEALRKQEDEQRGWMAEGMAMFGEILRANNDNMAELSYSIISNLVKYVKSVQGGFYIIEDNDEESKYFLLTASYAYERRKYADKRLEWGEGIVGACALEKDTIHLKKVPAGYLSITSGLGEATPDNLLIVPLKVNDEVHGVIEIASFKPFEEFEIGFIEKVAESIATTISSVKINIRTAQLLAESGARAEAMTEQETQLRQNMEELQATQEEAARQAEKFISFTNSVNHTLIRAEYDTAGILLYANTQFLHKLEYVSNSEVEGQPISMFVNKKDRIWFDELWQSLIRGGKHFEGDMKLVTRDGKDLWTIATYTCVRNVMGGVEKILFLAIDTTEQKKQSLDHEGQINALNRSSLKAEFSPTGDILDANEKFLVALGYTSVEIKTKTVFDFPPDVEKKSLEKIWDDVTHGMPFEGGLRFLMKEGEERWIRGTFTAVNDMYEEIAKVVFIGHDSTREKLMELETKRQTEILRIQEEQLRQSEVELSRKLREAREEVKTQFKEIEKVKIRNEKTLEGFLDVVISIDQDGTIDFFNKAAEQLFGYDRNEVLGKNVRLLFPADAAKHDEFIANFVDPDKLKIVGVRREITITNKLGDELAVLILLSEARVGKEYTYTAFIQNISVDLF
ncbi:PAS domain S-box protein [Williamwhitmania taraxaci]|uniref:Methyl-accepting chemotaxis protein n=1 Tax=Williamwhitmania taraxaci TaxID=1640674 RepID=A0A1G6J3B9_9BACT|nr:PAS domain S-box protein [Williamwhitmania taraxaci]SDC12496.1 methyl-accepting chemotaxis protein [Williamwhitmania taraxaci]